MKKWKIAQLFPRDTQLKFGLLREDENGNIHYVYLNGEHKNKLFVYSASFEVFYVHLTCDQYKSVWASEDMLKSEKVSNVGTFAGYDDTDYSEIMNRLYN